MLKLVIYPDDILEKVAEPITQFDTELAGMVSEMFDIMKAEHGIGLAAPQVGISKRLFVMGDGMRRVVINPEIVRQSGTAEMEEGCLSFPGITVKKSRSSIIDVKYQDETGKRIKEQLSGLDAICFQHEFDHLNGITFIESLSVTTRLFLKKSLQRKKNG